VDRQIERRGAVHVRRTLPGVGNADGDLDSGRDALYIAGGGIGVLLGMLGLALTRWEVTRGGLYFQPNAWLVLLVTLVIAGRIGYTAWRTWEAWQAGAAQMPATAAYGVRGTLAAAAVVLGYYTTFWIGVTRRLSEQRLLRSGSSRHRL
jgi:hypothetical protein